MFYVHIYLYRYALHTYAMAKLLPTLVFETMSLTGRELPTYVRLAGQ